jgi:prolyl 4-hydroxylase
MDDFDDGRNFGWYKYSEMARSDLKYIKTHGIIPVTTGDHKVVIGKQHADNPLLLDGESVHNILIGGNTAGTTIGRNLPVIETGQPNQLIGHIGTDAPIPIGMAAPIPRNVKWMAENATNVQVYSKFLANYFTKDVFGNVNCKQIAPGIFTIKNLFQQNACNDIIKLIDEWKSEQVVSFGTGEYTFHNDTHFNPTITDMVGEATFNMMPRLYLKQHDSKLQKCRYRGVTPVFAVAKYTAGQSFGKHYDASTKFPDRQGKFACIVYLNGHGNYDTAFTGGETVFYNKDNSIAATITPVTGTALVFDVDILHEGRVVTSGSKYWLSFEFCYRMC